MLILDEQDAKDAVNRYLDSREWWTILSDDWAKLIEDEYFQGEKNEHFHVMMVPLGSPWLIRALYFARKSVLPREELERLMGNTNTGAQDVISSSVEDLALALVLDRWRTT